MKAAAVVERGLVPIEPAILVRFPPIIWTQTSDTHAAQCRVSLILNTIEAGVEEQLEVCVFKQQIYPFICIEVNITLFCDDLGAVTCSSHHLTRRDHHIE
ncbi:MAG TPA: hypothetical protein DDZ84_07670 [Firmicutes bacterium]|jgi:hypothetical protein|nr:hypothetical protein [Bacillota bacterium]